MIIWHDKMLSPPERDWLVPYYLRHLVDVRDLVITHKYKEDLMDMHYYVHAVADLLVEE